MSTRKFLSGRRSALCVLIGVCTLVGATPAFAQTTESSGATALKANGLVDAEVANVSCPPSDSDDVLAVDADTGEVAGVVSANVLHAECTRNGAAASVANATIGGGDLVGGLELGLIESNCFAGSTATTGDSRVLDVNGNVISDANTTLTLDDGSVLEVVFNEQTTNEQGQFVVNAVRITVLQGADDGSLLGGGLLGGTGGTDVGQEVILAQSRCRQAGAVIPEVPVALLLPLSAAGLFGAAFLVLRRRQDGTSSGAAA